MQVEALQMTPVAQVHMSAESHIGENEPKSEIKTFGEFLKDSLGEVNHLQQESEGLKAKLAAGQLEDISQVVVASEKADIAMQFTLQVRNKIVEAYQEVMRMQV